MRNVQATQPGRRNGVDRRCLIDRTIDCQEERRNRICDRLGWPLVTTYVLTTGTNRLAIIVATGLLLWHIGGVRVGGIVTIAEAIAITRPIGPLGGIDEIASVLSIRAVHDIDTVVGIFMTLVGFSPRRIQVAIDVANRCGRVTIGAIANRTRSQIEEVTVIIQRFVGPAISIGMWMRPHVVLCLVVRFPKWTMRVDDRVRMKTRESSAASD